MTADTDAAYAEVAVRFVRALHDDRAADAAALVSPDVPVDRLSAETLGLIWTQLTARFGELAELGTPKLSAQDAYHSADIAARFARSELTIRVVLDGPGGVAGFWMSEPRPPAYEPPAYVDPAALVERELRIGSGPHALGATLSVPLTAGPHPAVVLVHGSGPNDRDETVGGNRPFRDLALGLAARGVVVLRYDKRTYAHPRQYGAAGWSAEREVVADAVEAMAVVRAQPEVDAARVFVLGHSLGAGFAPLIAERDPQAAGVVLLAGSARPLPDVLIEQIEYLDALGANPATAAQRDALVSQIRLLGTRELPDDTVVLGVPASYWYELGSHDLLAGAHDLERPALVLQGGRDYQATGRDLDLWRVAFAHNQSAAFRLYPHLNHLFMTGTGMATPTEYIQQTGHVDEQVVADIAHFVGGVA